MTMLFAQEYISQVWGDELKEEGLREGRQEGCMEITYELYKGGMSAERLSTLLEIPVKTLPNWFEQIETRPRSFPINRL